MSLDISLITSNQKLYDVLTSEFVAKKIISELANLLVSKSFKTEEEINNYLIKTIINKKSNNNFDDLISVNTLPSKQIFIRSEFDRLVTVPDINHVSYQIYQHFKDRMNISVRFLMDRVVEEFFKYLYSEKIDRLKKMSQTWWKLFSDDYAAYQTVPIRQHNRRPDPVFVYSMGDF